MSGGVVGVSCRDVASLLQARGFERKDDRGDHQIYVHPALGFVHVPSGGKWTKCQPRETIKHVAKTLGISFQDALQAVRVGR